MIESPQTVETVPQLFAAVHIETPRSKMQLVMGPGIRAWIKTENHEVSDDLYECYLTGPESVADPAQWRTELCRPLVR